MEVPVTFCFQTMHFVVSFLKEEMRIRLPAAIFLAAEPENAVVECQVGGW